MIMEALDVCFCLLAHVYTKSKKKKVTNVIVWGEWNTERIMLSC